MPSPSVFDELALIRRFWTMTLLSPLMLIPPLNVALASCRVFRVVLALVRDGATGGGVMSTARRQITRTWPTPGFDHAFEGKVDLYGGSEIPLLWARKSSSSMFPARAYLFRYAEAEQGLCDDEHVIGFAR